MYAFLRPATLALALALAACGPERAPFQPDTNDAGSNTCGLLGIACCANDSCSSGLACSSGLCQQPRQGDLGKPCARNADCESNTCLPLSGGHNVCTLACNGAADCVSGWSCGPISGGEENFCQCNPTTEICDGTDNDCDGIVDNQPIVNQQCVRDRGAQFTCLAGSCTGEGCTSNADCLAGQTCNTVTQVCESRVDGGHPIDAGTPDGGSPVDGGTDGGLPIDGGHPIDGGPTDGGPADGGVDGGFGVDGGCHLSGNASLDFGSVGVGTQSAREYVVTNDGTGVCTFPQAPTITSGSNSIFSVAGFSSDPLPVSSSAVVFVSYTPQDATTDTGQLRIPYGNSVHGTDLLNVSLSGTPVAGGLCRLTVTPSVTSAPGSLAFGPVRVGSEGTMAVTFQNTGTIACSLSNARLTVGFGTSSSVFRIISAPSSSLSPGSTTTATLGFQPTSETEYGTSFLDNVFFFVDTTDTSTFNGGACTDSGAFPPATGSPGCVGYKLTGSGINVHLRAVPASLDFGAVKTSCNSSTLGVRLYNDGASTITLTSLSLDPTSSLFSFLSPVVPVTIPTGSSVTVNVRYRPTSATTTSTNIVVRYTEASVAGPNLTIPMTGRGVSNTTQTDTFSQSARPKADILLIVDDSGSMAEEQSQLASNAMAFLGFADSSQADYQVAVVTTDMEDGTHSGRFQGTPKIVVPGSSAASSLATTIRNLGTNGSGIEQGLAAMVTALSAPLASSSGFNAGFLRPDARLGVIVVSDEEDQSPASTTYYEDYLTNLKGPYGASQITFSAIVGPTVGANGQSGCTSANGDAVAGARYIELQEHTGGSFQSICDSSWLGLASSIGGTLFTPRNSFMLSRIPSGSITVRVNGGSVSSSTYAYDSTSNSVVFSSGSEPAAGATVTLDYSAQCF